MEKSFSFNLQNAKDYIKNDVKMFLDERGAPGVARYEIVKYPKLDKFVDKQLAFFWRPEEVNLDKDRRDFKDLNEAQQHIFTSNLKRQTMLDSINGRSPEMAFLPAVSLPELENWIILWGQNETLHSRSYTHIIRNIYPNPSEIFDEITEIEDIVACANDISVYYDELIKQNALYQAKLAGIDVPYDKYQHKKAIWMALNCVNALEGIRFYVSFACSWGFAEIKQMEGNAKIIKLICRDENLHLASTQWMLKNLPKDDSDFEKIREETLEDVKKLFIDTIKQEEEWADYLFEKGSMIGLSATILKDYVRYIGAKRMRTVGLEVDFDYPGQDPLPWTRKWIQGEDVQVAPQETEITSYLISNIDSKIDFDKLEDML